MNMKKSIVYLLSVLAMSGLCFSQQNDTGAAGSQKIGLMQESASASITEEPAPVSESPVGLQWNGYVQVDDRVRTNQHYRLSFQEYRLGLDAEVKIAERAHCFSQLWIRSLGFPDVTSSESLTNSNNVSPVRIDLREAYFDIYNLFVPRLDLRIGRQRIAWGTGDKFNPTDNLNPADLEDIWDYGRRLGSDGVKLSYYRGIFKVEAAYIPFFRPAVLPGQEWMSALSPPMALVPGSVQVVTQSDTIILPGEKVQETSSGGIKTSLKLFNFDFSLSYAYTRDGLPLLNKIIITPAGIGYPLPVNLRAQLMYPRMHAVGFDFSGAVVNVGVWGEGAVFIPRKVSMITNKPRFKDIINGQLVFEQYDSISTALDSKPYVKFVVGLDYTFPANIYINAQYVHGFTSERGRDELEDYLLANLDWKLLNETLTLSPAGIGLEIKDYKDIKDNYAFVAQPQLQYDPIDNAEITFGARFIMGTNSTHFGKVVNNDEVYIKARYSF